MNCALRHIGCNSIHVSDELRGNSASKSWRSQFMMRKHQFIHRKQTEQEYKDLFPFSLALSACLGVPRSECYELWGFTYMGFGLTQVHLTSQMRCSHYVEYSNSPLRITRFFYTSFCSVCAQWHNRAVFPLSIFGRCIPKEYCVARRARLHYGSSGTSCTMPSPSSKHDLRMRSLFRSIHRSVEPDQTKNEMLFTSRFCLV